MLDTVGSSEWPRGQVPTRGSAPCSYSGYTVVTGHQEMQPQQVLAAKLK